MSMAGGAAAGHAWDNIATTLSQLPITNVMQLRKLADSQPGCAGSVCIEGTVWWSDNKEGRLILHDASGTEQMELDMPCQMPHQGDRVRLEGNCTVGTTMDAILLSPIPVVENDGLHAAIEKSGSLYLKAGRPSIQVSWFNRDEQPELVVAYEGPDLPRQKIPGSVLFRAQIDPANGTTNFVNGLDYRCCEGTWLLRLPDLNHPMFFTAGAAGNFDLAVKSRKEGVSLQFSGFIQIARECVYTFYTRSSDGSRLFLGDSSLQIKPLGQATLPTPRPVALDSLGPGAEDYQWCEIEGTVNFVNRDKVVLEIDLATGSGRVKAKIADRSGCSFSLVPQNWIRTVGVRRTVYHLDGSRAPCEMYVQSWKDIEQRYITPQLWALYPLLTISDVMTISLALDPTPVVHLRGRIMSGGPGQPMFLEDESGRMEVSVDPSAQSSEQASEVLARLSLEGANRVLRCGFARRVGESSGASNTLPILTTVEQVNQLSPEEMGDSYPAKLRGVVTMVMGKGVLLQDTTRALFVEIVGPSPLQTGDYGEVEGTVVPGEFNPYMKASRVQYLGAGTLPNPVRPTWDQLLNGSLHLQYVELEGVVTLMDRDAITLLTRDGRIKVGLESALPPICQNALVRMRGCLWAAWDKQTHRVEVGRIVLTERQVSVVQPAPSAPFALPTKRVEDLLRFDPQASAGALQRVKVSGQVVYRGSQGCYLMDGGNGLRFMPAGKMEGRVGDLVEVVGFPELSGPSPVIQEAAVRRLGVAELPKPHKIEADNLVRDEYDSTWVQLDGVLVGLTSKLEMDVIEMQSGLRRFTAMLGDKSGLPETMTIGSGLQLTGVYVGQGGNRVLGRPIDSFQLLLNSGSDVRIVSRPPWWNLRRLLTAFGLLAGFLLAALIWIKLLRRKVAERTIQLESQIHERQRAEHQREMEQERARVAHDLHDELGTGLTRVNILTSLVSRPDTAAEEKSRYLENLEETARDMVTSLDEIVWAVNPRNDTLASLAGYFGAHAQRLLELASVKCGLDVAENLPDIPLDPKFRHEILMAFKEAINNVICHSRASKVMLRIAIQNGRLVLEVSDNGRGIGTGGRETGADGLANMRERLNALGGRCEIHSEPDRGTTVRFEAPLPKTAL
jgi:signal transduction histidine kinase